MPKCEWCQEEIDGKLEIIIGEVGRFSVCGTCMNLYGNEEFDELNRRLKADPMYKAPEVAS
jgi:ribosome-binding protein aMBF1 (putative translation factor)